MLTLNFNRRSTLRTCCGSGLAAVIAMGVFGCNIGKGIADFGNNLANPDLITVGGPGVRVAKGKFASPLVDPWDDSGPVIVAFEFKADGPHLAMRPLNSNGGAGCDTGLAYSSIVRDKLDNLTQLIAYSEGGDSDGYGRVHFVDHQCKEYGQPIENAKLPATLYKDPPGYLVSTRTQLLIVAPWTNSIAVLADNVTWWDTWSDADKSIAVIADGHFKVFDAQQHQIADIGSSVSQVTRLGSSGGFLLTDGNALRSYKSLSDTTPFEIAADACEPSPDSTGCLFFYSPCSTRQLMCYRADTQTTIPIDTGVRSLVSARTSSLDSTARLAVLYSKHADDGTTDLWLYSSGDSPRLLVSRFAQLYSWSPPDNEIDALVNSDGDVGQAIRHTPKADDVVIADSVSVNFSQGLLANFDKSLSVGDLYGPVQLGQTPALVAHGVPYVPHQDVLITSKNPDTVKYGKAALTNSDGSLGDLTLLRFPPSSADGPDSPDVLASNVPIGKYRFFLYNINALAYADAWDKQREVGSLNIHELDLDTWTFVADEVREFVEIFWPWEGLMYVVPDGDRAGIWVTRAK